ncbi:MULTISPECIES: hypothetical protein [unclassified Halomonas]|uniref:hypothetical protein n=1 Tax=unclassified Halomonas TaxID=2609666 RepID=UPI00209D2599|nr:MULTISPECIES: hypothetical protein [unclassified Halomonas]MCP1314161.1 hypothetical protein [Halomonas sp. 707D7]MCP1326573.1 hypothetical protein [Halomonas sp. 707D4]
MVKARRGIAMVAGLLLLAGCNEQPDEPAPVPEPARHEAATQADDTAREPEPLEVAVTAHVELASDRRLMVAGETNLPEGTRLQVVVERELSRVRWQSRTAVTGGQFRAGPFGSGSGLPDGGYIVRVQSSEASVQPQAVQEVIGSRGEYLAGELVTQTRHGLGQVTTYSRRFLVGSEPRRTRDQVDVVED